MQKYSINLHPIYTPGNSASKVSVCYIVKKDNFFQTFYHPFCEFFTLEQRGNEEAFHRWLQRLVSWKMAMISFLTGKQSSGIFGEEQRYPCRSNGHSGGIKKRAGQFFCSFSRKDVTRPTAARRGRIFFHANFFPLLILWLVVQVIDCASVTVLLLLGGNAAGILSLHSCFLNFYRHDALICKICCRLPYEGRKNRRYWNWISDY